MRPLKSLLFFSLFTILLLLSACGPAALEPGDPLTYVPDEVSSVTAMNIGRLMEKADFDEVREMAFYQDMLEEVSRENAAVARILEDPRRAGINLDRNIYLNMELDTPEENGLVTVVFALADRAAFEQTLTDLDLQFVPASREPGLLANNASVLTWNEEAGILGIGSVESLQQRTAAYLLTDKASSISNNDHLRKALREDFDILNWVSSKAFVERFGIADIGKMARYSEEDLKENYLHSYINFEDGAFRAETRFDLQRKLAADLALVLNDEVKTDFSDKIPHEDLFFYTNLAIRPKGINQLLIEYHVKGLSDQSLGNTGISVDDLIKAFSGDAAVAIYQEQGGVLNFPSLLLALKVDERESLDRLLEAAQKEELLERVGPDRYQLYSRSTPDSTEGALSRTLEAEILIQGDMLYFSDEAERLARIRSGDFEPHRGLPEDLTALTARHAMAMLIDVAHLSDVKDDLAEMPVKRVQATAGRKGMSAVVEMGEEDVNTLKQFLEWMNGQYEEKQDRERQSGEDESS